MDEISLAGLKANAEYWHELYVKGLKIARDACEKHTINFVASNVVETTTNESTQQPHKD